MQNDPLPLFRCMPQCFVLVEQDKAESGIEACAECLHESLQLEDYWQRLAAVLPTLWLLETRQEV